MTSLYFTIQTKQFYIANLIKPPVEFEKGRVYHFRHFSVF